MRTSIVFTRSRDERAQAGEYPRPFFAIPAYPRAMDWKALVFG